MAPETVGGPRWLEPALQVVRARYFGGPQPEERGDDAWLRAIAAARTERLGPVLSEAASHLGVELPRSGWAALAADRLANEERYAAQLEALDDLGPRIEGRGVPAAIIKGPALARHYPVAAVREAADIDLLVPSDALSAAEACLNECGFRRWSSGGRPATRYAVTYARAADGGLQVAVDLHPRWHEIRIEPDGETARIGGREATLGRTGLGQIRWRVLPPAAELYLASAHAILSSLRTISVYLDLAVLMHAAGSEAVDWAAATARETGRDRHLRHATTLAAELFGLEMAWELRSRPARLGVPTGLRLGHVAPGARFLPSSLLMELVLRRGWKRKLDFVRWVLGHRGRTARAARAAPEDGARRWLGKLAGLRWLKGSLLRYRRPGSTALRS
ncbi:MAG: nucleotidyltransferase family protein [Gemmatimonadetes bacterium]|uniref:Nucleotidyltransferase family protein n=1 Tax=Candidatus Kutchimonas denitrificans TaxID=3056748 RepID=A0AAE4ZAL2_9BACT|nr:nucleotidyltransferase family protein [Gemmatimonadota bacterium]NIR73885.1 nucleotidyltransferase family protein [Candidatus Kutchimonas denitrificans]NIR99691.1 nucleotidyltransferase family protein [Gemmatimonadota bacterium]NIT65276.1 nucleotidyltransferase family protein [Gemmatimonadota bacterium]NIW73725.1 hypothetical protein [Gemmatimonadota bacterium]